MKVLLTGCAGFIGSNLAQTLLSSGDSVFGIDNLDPYYDIRIKEMNLKGLSEYEDFHFTKGDITCPDDIGSAVEDGVDMIVHLAARAGVRASLENPPAYARTNIVGTLNILEFARQHGIGQVVAASSSSVYGDTSTPPYREDDPGIQPISPYGLTKLHTEHYCRLYSKMYGMDITALRFFTVFCPGQRPDMAIHGFIRAIMNGSTIRMFGDGSTYRDYTYVDDIVAGIRAAMSHTGGFRIYNLGSGRPIKLSEMIDTAARTCSAEAVIETVPIPPGDVQGTFADVSKAHNELGYNPSVPFEEGVRKEYQWIRKMVESGIYD